MGGREGGAKVKAGPPGPAPLRGGWGREGVPTPNGTHPRLGVQQGGGDPGGDSGGGEGIPRPKGEIGGPLGGQRIKREHGQVSPAHLDPQEPAEILGLTLCPPRPPPAMRVLKEWEEGKGEQK